MRRGPFIVVGAAIALMNTGDWDVVGWIGAIMAFIAVMWAADQEPRS